jgi:EpsI family protein
LGATISKRRILIVTGCFLAVSVLIYWQPEVEAARKETSLQQILFSIDGWHNGGRMPLDAGIREELKLDDYANNYFTNGRNRISFYIGYYLTSKNVGAAHSPLVCFPGQGWLLSDFDKRTVRVDGSEINLMVIKASTAQKKELLIYWFQAFERTSPGTFWQKIYVLLSKYTRKREDNAFVRVTLPMDEMSEKVAYEVGVRFIEAFYPIFLDYVRQGKESR